jgi:hypothetical protein
VFYCIVCYTIYCLYYGVIELKTNKDFKLSKSSKRSLALLHGDKHKHWRKMLIDAELCESRAKLMKHKEVKFEKGE